MNKQKLCCSNFCKFLNDVKMPIAFRKQDLADDYYGNMFVFSWFIADYPRFSPIPFCPWCGNEFESAFLLTLQDKLMDLDVKEADCADFSLETEIPEQFNYLKNRNWFDNELAKERKEHKNNDVCDMFKYCLAEDKPIIYIPNKRTYGILRVYKFMYFETAPRESSQLRHTPFPRHCS